MHRYWLLAGAALALVCAHGASAAPEGIRKPPKGYTALFNGKDLTNWQGLVDVKRRSMLTPDALRQEQAAANDKMRAHWTVKDGVLMYDGLGDSLQTARDYGNFELWVDWKIQPKGDSGIYLRGNPQVQIWDENGPGSRDASGKYMGSGGLYNNKFHPKDPLVPADNPAGEWNTFWIRMVGDKVTVKLNGKLVVDNTPLENYWFPGQPLPTRGPIELQHHHSPLQFRNIFLRELPDNAAASHGEAEVKQAGAPAAHPQQLVTLELSHVPLRQALQMVTNNSTMDVVVKDPDHRIGTFVIPYVNIKNKPVERALELVCRSAGAQITRNADGVYVVTARPAE